MPHPERAPLFVGREWLFRELEQVSIVVEFTVRRGFSRDDLEMDRVRVWFCETQRSAQSEICLIISERVGLSKGRAILPETFFQHLKVRFVTDLP